MEATQDTLFRRLVEAVTRHVSPDSNFLTMISDSTVDGDSNTENIQQIGRSLLPVNCDVRILPGGQGFLPAQQAIIRAEQPENVFLVPPIVSRSKTSGITRKNTAGAELQEVIIESAAIEIPVPGNLISLVPFSSATTVRAQEFRRRLSSITSLEIVLTIDNTRYEFPGWHQSVKLCLLVLRKGVPSNRVLKFFKCPTQAEGPSDADILSDLSRLLRQGGGETKFGYVLRSFLEPGAPLLHDKYSPLAVRREEGLRNLGDLRNLSDVANVLHLLHPVFHGTSLVESSSGNGVPVLEGRDISRDGSLLFQDTRYKAENVTDSMLLLQGDLCIRAFVGPADTNLAVAEIQNEDMPLTALQSVLVLRIQESISPEERNFIVSYLRSSIALDILRANGVGLQLRPSELANLPVPLAEPTVALALHSLTEAESQFRKWSQECESARNSIFRLGVSKEARLQVLSQGSLARQRVRAATLVSDFALRVRTRFPHPIAYRWRALEASRTDLDGYLQLLDCAETCIAYLASVAIVISLHSRVKIRWLDEMATRLSGSGQRGTSMGDWIAVLREVRDSKAFANLSGYVPFFETLKFMEKQEVNNAVQFLKTRRDDSAHGRGPRGHAVTELFAQSMAELKVFLEAVEFLEEYPLRYIEETTRDSILGTTRYTYRDLIGDHPLAPLQSASIETAELEASSLYLIDRTGEPLLARPLLSRRTCPECGNWATFYLDRYNRLTDEVYLKSLEHGHVISDGTGAHAFRRLGLLV